MPTKGNPRHAFRFEPELWQAFTEAVRHDPHGRDTTAVIRDFAVWYSRRKGAPKPERPASHVPTPPAADLS
jgi:hypothetical protein